MNAPSQLQRPSLEDSLPGINPLPPTPAKRKAIIALLKGDRALLEALDKERVRRKIVVAQNESNATVAAACLEVLQADLSRAKIFHEYLKKAKNDVASFADYEQLEAQYPADVAAQHRPNVASLNRAKISTLSNAHNAHLLKMSAQATNVVDKASSEVEYQQEELRGALMLVEMAQKDLLMISHQVYQIKEAIYRKTFILQAIWRVPNKIWISIFAYSTDTVPGEITKDSNRIRKRPFWYGSLAISHVCRLWRTMAMSCPRLWSNIVIFRGGFKSDTFSRVRHYLSLAKDAPKTLLIDGPKSTEPLARHHWDFLREGRTSINKIICVVPKGDGNVITTHVLSSLPPTPELWLLKAHESQPSTRTNTVEIPDSFRGVLAHLVTDSVNVTLSQGGSLSGPGHNSSKHFHLLSYTTEYSSVVATWSIDVFMPLSTLTDIHVRTGWMSEAQLYPDQPTTLPQVKTLHTTLNFLFLYLSHRFRLPALASLTILAGPDAGIKHSAAFKAWISSTCIKSLVCESMRDTGALHSLIGDLNALSSLELRGETVSSVLSSLVPTESPGPLVLVSAVSRFQSYPASHYAKEGAALSSLKQLTIASYSGDGEPIISFLHRWKGQDKPSPYLRTLNVTILADECPGLSLEVRKRIISLAGRRDRCESSFL